MEAGIRTTTGCLREHDGAGSKGPVFRHLLTLQVCLQLSRIRSEVGTIGTVDTRRELWAIRHVDNWIDQMNVGRLQKAKVRERDVERAVSQKGKSSCHQWIICHRII